MLNNYVHRQRPGLRLHSPEHHVKNCQDFAGKIKTPKVDTGKTMVAYVASLSACIPTSDVKWGDILSGQHTELNCPRSTFALCSASVLQPPTSNWEKASTDRNTAWAYWCPEQVEAKALTHFSETIPNPWFRYADGARVKIKTNILLFYFNHPLLHKLGVIQTLNHKWHLKGMRERRKRTWKIRKFLKIVVILVGPLTSWRIISINQGEMKQRCHTIWQWKSPKYKTPRHKQSNVVYAIQCSEECTDLYIGETKQPLHRRNTGEPTP